MRVIICSLMFLILLQNATMALTCRPTAPDELGLFYRPDAAERTSVGKGYVLAGSVRSSADCSPISHAKVEFWMAGPYGEYGEEFLETLFSSRTGAFRFENHGPPPYFGRPPHIHIRVSVPGFRVLVTQHYPEPDSTAAVFDLVFVPK